MKKNRLLFLLPLLAAFALTSCDQLLSNLNFNGPRKRSSQEDSEVLDDSKDYFNSSSSNKASSRSSGRTSSSRTSSSRSSSSSDHQHTWGEWIDVIAPTCTEQGERQRECSVCHETQHEAISPTGHNWGEWGVLKETTCTQDGIIQRFCQYCGAGEQEVIPAFGHIYDDESVVWQTEPTCTEGGRGTVQCVRCGVQIVVNSNPYGHDLHEIDYHSPLSGKASVHLYECTRCGITYLKFNVLQVTNESKSRLVFTTDEDTQEIGARFFGHPIGNDVALNENGDPDSNNHEPIYNQNQIGDYFELSFDLSDQQASILSTCRLYCDAKPYEWLYQNRLDFFAHGNTGAELWDGGYYIDNNPDHYNSDGSAKAIEGYRYALYVDNEFQEFDDSISNPVPEGNPRGEYVVPYTFHLHSGTNNIRLHMAGGYKSTFYNFIFRPVDLPQHVHRWSNEQLVGSYAEGYVGYTTSSCPTDGAVQLSINALEGTFEEGSKNKTGISEGYLKLASNNNSISYKFMYDGPAVTAKLYQVGYMDNWSANKNKTYTSASTSGSQTMSPCGCNFGINFNGLEVEIDEETKNTPFDVFLAGAKTVVDASGCSNAGPCYIGEVNLVIGENYMRYTRYASYNLNISHLLLVIE